MALYSTLGPKKPVVVPHGVAHMTPASKQMHALGLGSPLQRGVRTRKRRVKAKKKAHKAHARAARSTKSQLVKGSAAAKKRMAALRKMRGKKKG
jgi:hypothetical protein